MLSGIITVGLLLLFLAVWIWAWQPRHKAGFDAAARLAVEDEATSGQDTEEQP